MNFKFLTCCASQQVQSVLNLKICLFFSELCFWGTVRTPKIPQVKPCFSLLFALLLNSSRILSNGICDSLLPQTPKALLWPYPRNCTRLCTASTLPQRLRLHWQLFAIFSCNVLHLEKHHQPLKGNWEWLLHWRNQFENGNQFQHRWQHIQCQHEGGSIHKSVYDMGCSLFLSIMRGPSCCRQPLPWRIARIQCSTIQNHKSSQLQCPALGAELNLCQGQCSLQLRLHDALRHESRSWTTSRRSSKFTAFKAG